MRHLPLSLSVLFVATLMVSLLVNSDDSEQVVPVATPVETSLSVNGDDEKVQHEVGRAPVVENTSDDAAAVDIKDPAEEIAIMTGGAVTQQQAGIDDAPKDKEEVWAEISEAISGLNDMVGDEMFRNLRRTENNRMEVRVDMHFWQRVRYETRVDLKSDISNIWHLYVLQYSDVQNSSVYFIDDETNKTIDIFSQFK